MNSSPNSAPFSLPDAAPDLARRFALILAGLAALVARRFLRVPHLMRFTVLLCSRLSRAVRRFHRALTQPATKLRAPRVRADRTDAGRAQSVALPSGRGWLVRELGWEAAGYMAQLEALITEVEMRAVVDRLPAAGRILRPICRMLGVPVAVMPVAVARPALDCRVETPREPVDLPWVGEGCAGIATSD